MFVRFVVQQLDPDSGRRQGLFQAMTALEAKGKLLEHEEAIYRDIYKWFQKHLRRPRSFTRSAKPHAKKVAISWFKESAAEHVAKMREIAAILESHGVRTQMITTTRPGYIVYEDSFQVAAEPYLDTTT